MRILSARKKRGFTLAETVVAMTVILLVTVSAVTTVAYAVNLTQRNRDRTFFAIEVENLLQCYLGDGLETGEDSLIQFHYGISPQKGENGTLYFRYDSARRPTSGTWRYEIEAKVDEKGFFAIARNKNGRELYRMKTPVLRAEGGNV